MAVRTLIFLAIIVLAGCGAGDAPTADAEEAVAIDPTEPEANSASSEQGDDPNNPWVLGYRFSGTPGVRIRVEWAARSLNYERRKQSGVSRPFDEVEQNHEIGVGRDVALATVYIKGLKIRATIKQGTGTFKIEMLRGRMVDPNDPAGDVEVKEVLETGEASGEDGVVLLATGEAFDEQPSHW